MARAYDFGDAVTLSILFMQAGAPADPATVTLNLLDPNGNAATYTYGVDAILQRVTVGEYQAVIDPPTAGRWQWRFAGTGTPQQAQQDFFTVRDNGNASGAPLPTPRPAPMPVVGSFTIASGLYTVHVSFGTTFLSVPKVDVGHAVPTTATSEAIDVQPGNVTTTGCDLTTNVLFDGYVVVTPQVL